MSNPFVLVNRSTSHAHAALIIATIFFAAALPWSSNANAEEKAGHSHQTEEKPLGPADPAKLHQPGELPDIGIGDISAPVTIVEYASITCSHCGRFHRELLPELKKKYIDTGKARLILREFPLESVAAAAALIARCTGTDKTYDAVSTMFERQQQWLRKDDLRPDLMAIAAEYGMSKERFEACLKDEALFKKMITSRTRGHEEFGVKSTPTFFINGKPLVGPRSIAEFDAIIQPMLAN